MKYLQITLLAQVFTEFAHELGTNLLTKSTYIKSDLKNWAVIKTNSAEAGEHADELSICTFFSQKSVEFGIFEEQLVQT